MFGAYDDSVYQAQQLLNKQGFSLTEDGLIGPNTINAVKEFQTQNKLTPTGVIDSGLLTLLKLMPAVSSENILTRAISKVKETYKNSPQTVYIIGGSVVFLLVGMLFLKRKLRRP